MQVTLTALALASTFLAPAQEAETRPGAGRRGPSIDAIRAEARMESKLGFTIYDPQFLSARDLLRYASDLTDDKVRYVFEDVATGRIQVGTRRRFIAMGEVIGVQDFEAGRKAAIGVLVDLDTRLGAAMSDRSTPPSSRRSLVRTVRLRTLEMQTALRLISDISPDLAISAINETGTIVLRGTVEAVGTAESLLLEVDQPLPQVTLRCALIQAVDADDTNTEGLMNDEVAQSLGRMLPGKRFREVGELLIRGSAGGGAEFEVTSSLPGFGGNDSTPPARVSLTTTARGLDAETKTLTLDQFSMRLEIPTFQVTATGRGDTQQNFAGYRTEGLRADLALRSGETTVVGSLDGDQIYVSLTFTIEK